VDFTPIKGTRTGVYGRCRACRNARSRARYHSAPDVRAAEIARASRNQQARRLGRRRSVSWYEQLVTEARVRSSKAIRAPIHEPPLRTSSTSERRVLEQAFIGRFEPLPRHTGAARSSFTVAPSLAVAQSTLDPAPWGRVLPGGRARGRCRRGAAAGKPAPSATLLGCSRGVIGHPPKSPSPEPTSNAAEAPTTTERLRARCCYGCLRTGQLAVAALRPSEHPRRRPRGLGWVLHTVQFSTPFRLYRITRVAHTTPAFYSRGRTLSTITPGQTPPLRPAFAQHRCDARADSFPFVDAGQARPQRPCAGMGCPVPGRRSGAGGRPWQ